MAWTPPATAVAGTVATAAFWNTNARDNLKAIGDPWTTYTPTYTGINAIGNATVVAKYLQAGKLVIGYVKVTMGSTTTFSAASLSVSIPVAPALLPHDVIGSAFMQDTSASAFRTGTVITNTGLSVFIVVDGAAGVASNLVPWTWATTDILSYSFTYEAA